MLNIYMKILIFAGRGRGDGFYGRAPSLDEELGPFGRGRFQRSESWEEG